MGRRGSESEQWTLDADLVAGGLDYSCENFYTQIDVFPLSKFQKNKYFRVHLFELFNMAPETKEGAPMEPSFDSGPILINVYGNSTWLTGAPTRNLSVRSDLMYRSRNRNS